MLRISNRAGEDARIDVQTESGDALASYRFGAKLPKPCFHPLTTARGRVISSFEPADHLWHRGLWFTIKFINGTNFWEEREPFGMQVSRQMPKCENVSDNSVRISHLLKWTSEATGDVIDENREIVVAMREDGSRQIDWHTTLHPLADLLLDRTPYTTWGGYSGLAFRAPVEARESGYLLPEGKYSAAIIGERHPWISWQGIVGGDGDGRVSMALIDHPNNPRSPQPWYGRSGEKYDFMNAAFLFHEPMKVGKGERLDFKYRVIYRDGWWSGEEVARVGEDFRRG